MKILTIDLETAPNLAHCWSLWDQNIGLSQLLESGHVMCFAAKWYHEKKTMFFSEWEHGKDAMLQAAYDLVNEADVVVHFNGKRFDMPWLNSEWVRAGYTPPSPYAEVDLCQVVKRRFKFPSNKLDYVANELLGERKVKHEGHELWILCLAGDAKAWGRMEKYNRKDVVLTEKLYDRIRSWVPNLPNPALYGAALDGEHTCPECGGVNLVKEGYAYTKVSVFQQYACRDCGRWSRGAARIEGVDLR